MPEARKLVLAMAEPEGRRRFLLGWSAWRRAHQAVAARCRAARRALGRRDPPEELRAGPEATVLGPEGVRFTDAEWEFVGPLLPPRRGRVGRPLNDHREVLGGMLWVARTGSSWREMPEEYGDWSTAYRRWRAWKKRGLWRHVLEVLEEEDLPGPATKEH